MKREKSSSKYFNIHSFIYSSMLFKLFSKLGRGQKIAVLFVFFSLLLSIGSLRLFEGNKSGEILVVQGLSGNVNVHLTPGIKWVGFGRITIYKKEDDYNFQKGVRFSDNGNAVMTGSFRYRLPEDEETIKKLHAAYPSVSSLHESLIGNTVDRAVYTAGPLMTSDESASEKKNDLLFYIEDQAQRGVYKTEKLTATVIDASTGKEAREVRNVIVEDSTGVPLRVSKSDLAEYGITLYRANIDEIDYDAAIEQQLKVKLNAEMAVQKAKAEALSAEQDALKAEADGRKRVAEINATKAVELAEAVANARKDSIQASIQLTTARLKAQQERVEADAKAYANRQLVMSGLTPMEAAKIKKETAIGIAEALSKRPVPSVVSGGGNGTSDPTEVLLLKMLQESFQK